MIVFKYVKANYKEDEDSLFFVAVRDSTMSNGLKLHQRKCRLEIKVWISSR